MSYKRIIPCIFLLQGKAVRWFDDRELLSEDAIALAKHYSDQGADELLVFDLSDSDEDHEESIDLLRKSQNLSGFRLSQAEISSIWKMSRRCSTPASNE